MSGHGAAERQPLKDVGLMARNVGLTLLASAPFVVGYAVAAVYFDVPEPASFVLFFIAWMAGGVFAMVRQSSAAPENLS